MKKTKHFYTTSKLDIRTHILPIYLIISRRV